jgi:glutaredoxin
MADLYTLSPSQIVLYGAAWCGDCRRARRIFAENSIHFLDIDIEQDEKAAEFVKNQNRGFQSVPTIIFPDGSRLTEPDRTTLNEKLQYYRQAA